jgi:glycerol dehydrogenase
MSLLRIAPIELVRGGEAVEALARRIAARTAAAGIAPRLLLVHGEVGYPAVRERLDPALDDAGLVVTPILHRGPCHPGAIDAVRVAATDADAAWLLGVGGGRVLDVAKGAAHDLGRPYAALPTSPATCAATAPTVVVYDEAGGHLEAREGGASAELVALDGALLGSAPDRLLASGIVDGWAKIHEVRLTSGRSAERSAGARAALALVDDLARLLHERGAPAIAAGPGGRSDPARLADRRLVAEAAVAYPGLIGGLAGAAAKLALAHPLHDALTRVPGSHAALHGEKVGFGSLVQILLAGRDGLRATPAERRAAMRDEAERYLGLGFACHLEALGCGEVRGAERRADVVAQALADASVRQAFPDLTAGELDAAIVAVDEQVRELAAAGATSDPAAHARSAPR